MSIENNTNIIERLFKAGAHFGFSKSRRHPSVVPFLFGSKGGTDIFDLEITSEKIDSAKKILADAGENGKKVLFVGTKEEVSKLVQNVAENIEMPFVVNRWIGGMMTNYSEIQKRISRLKVLDAEKESGELERKYTKKERVMIGREVDKLKFNFEGIKDIDGKPALMVVVDPRHNFIAVQEANDMKIPVIAVMSSDCDVTKVQTSIMVNDALTSSVELVLTELSNAYKEGRAKYVAPPERSSRPIRGADGRRVSTQRTFDKR